MVNRRGTPGLLLASLRACLAAEPAVVAGYVFGSVATGHADATSDLDVAVLCEEDLDAGSALDLQLRLVGCLAEHSARPVDLVSLNAAAPMLAYEVVTEGALLYERSAQERVSFQARVYGEYFDFAPWLEFHARSLLKDIQEVGLSGRKRRHGGALEAPGAVRERSAGVTGT